MKSLQNVETGLEDSPMHPPCADMSEAKLTGEWRVFFDGLTSQPLPDRMLELAQALEEAFGRGDLYDQDVRRPS
jgi:hypothetical protein